MSDAREIAMAKYEAFDAAARMVETATFEASPESARRLIRANIIDPIVSALRERAAHYYKRATRPEDAK